MGRTVCLVLIILPNVDVGPTMDGVTIRYVVVMVVVVVVVVQWAM